MNIVTFLRMRPAGMIEEAMASTRRRAGTTALQVEVLDAASRRGAIAGGILTVGRVADGEEPAAWVVVPADALQLAKRGVSGTRISVEHVDERAAVIEALARAGAAFLRTGRRRVPDAAAITSLPGLDASVSVFVDSVADALAAVEAGAGDLLLRGWSAESIGELRDALDARLVERTAIAAGMTVDRARRELDSETFTVWLNQVDAAGLARPRTDWAPGKDIPAPIPEQRFSAQWPDSTWTNGGGAVDLRDASSGIAPILDRALAGQAPSTAEIAELFAARGRDVDAIAWAADQIRRDVNGETVTYVVNRNINYTNQCYYRCGFCAFSKGPRSLNLRGDPYLLTIPQVVERTVEAHRRGATEVCLQGGIHPGFTGDFYVTVVEAIKEAVPDMHIHGFTPLEVWQGAETLGVDVRSFLERLRDAGLGTLPGTAAEILDDRIREHLCPDKIGTAQWAEVMITAHELGLRSTSTIMFGHIDDAVAWANHIEVLRRIQRRTGGITEFVPLPFVHMGAPIYLRGLSRPGPTWDEVVLIHAVARIAFVGLIDNIQASWVKLGIEGGKRLLDAGCNDLGGTLMDEIISRSAGAAHGTFMEAADFERAIVEAGRVPRRRTTLYEAIETVTPLTLR